MSITHQASTPAQPKKRLGRTTPRAPIIRLDQPGLLRVAHLLAIFSIGHSTLYAGLKLKPGDTTTRYPKPDGRDGKFPWWRTSTIKDFLDVGAD